MKKKDTHRCSRQNQTSNGNRRHSEENINGATSDENQSSADNGKKGNPRKTKAQVILGLLDMIGASSFHDEAKDLYLTIPVNGHRETWPLNGKDCKTLIQGLYYIDTGDVASAGTIGQVLAVLAAKALYDNLKPVPLSTRIVNHDGAIWYDLSNQDWQAVRVTEGRWEIVDNPPTLFRRYRHQAAQVMPQPGGDVRKILRHVKLNGQETLFLCWLICSFVPGIPHAMPILHGIQGTGKTTTCSLIKTIIDPSMLNILTLNRDMRSLVICLQQHWFLPFDNVSKISDELSDTLCRAITGKTSQQRKLFKDADDVIFTFKRILALNGINNAAHRPDLIDRALLFELQRISDSKRREEADVLSAFEADRPAILGGIFDILCKAISIYPSVKLESMPRMADFARWGYAVGEALGGLGPEFLNQYEDNREIQNTELISIDPVASLVVELMARNDRWHERVSDFRLTLKGIAKDHGINPQSKGFPKADNALSRHLTRITPVLEQAGIKCENSGHTRNGSYITLSRAQ